jgi:hypothetical protein
MATAYARIGQDEAHRWGDSLAISWRGLGTITLVCLLLSTQIFFQVGALDYLASGRLLDGWLALFAEAFLCGIAMWAMVAAAQRLLRSRSARVSVPAIAVGLLAGGQVGVTIALLAFQPPGFFPPFLSVAGDALRWSLWGGILLAVHAQLRRRAQALTAIAAADLENARIERRKAEAELDVLRAQIEPHFLFNTLAHLRRQYRTDPASGAQCLAQLRHYLREALPQVRSAHCTLERELQLVRAYLELLRSRMGARLEFSIEMAPGLAARPVPPMIVLTLVENAVKHGIQPRAEGGAISIVASSDGRAMRIEVRDTGEGLRDAAGHGVGLANARARLRAAFGADARLSIGENSPRGVVAAIETTAP